LRKWILNIKVGRRGLLGGQEFDLSPVDAQVVDLGVWRAVGGKEGCFT
jgi:hypothetical protein